MFAELIEQGGVSRLGVRQEAHGPVVGQHLGGDTLFHRGLGLGTHLKLQSELDQRDIVVLAAHAAGDQPQAVDIQGIVVGKAASPLTQLEQQLPMFRLAAAGHQLLQRHALGRFVTDFVGAAGHKLQGGVGTGEGLGVPHAAGEVVRLVIGLADQQLLLGSKSVVLLEGIGIGDHIAVLAGIIIIGEFGLGARRTADRGVAGRHRDKVLHLIDDGGVGGGLVGLAFSLVHLGHGAAPVAGLGHGIGFIQQGAHMGAHGGLGLSRGCRQGYHGRGTQKNRRHSGTQNTDSHNKTSFNPS